MNRRVLGNSFLNIGISVFDKAITFVSIPIFTRLMTADTYGAYSTYLAWVGILEHVIGLSMEYSLRTAYFDYKGEYEQFNSSIFSLSSMIAGGIISVIALIGGVFDIAIINVVLLCAVHSFILFLTSCLDYKFTIMADYKRKAIIKILPPTCGFLLSLWFVLAMKNNTFVGRIVGTLIGYGIIIVILVSKVFFRGRTFYKERYWRYALSVSIPLVFHGLSNVVLANSDRIMISMIRSNSEAGIYSTAYSMGLIGVAVFTAMESLWIPWFSNRLSNMEIAYINNGFKIYLVMGVLCTAGVILVGPDILKIMTTNQYWEGKIVLIPIALGGFLTFLYSISADLEIYYKDTVRIAQNTSIAAGVNIVLNFLLIKDYGMSGAAFATVVSYLLLFILHYKKAKDLNPDLFPLKDYLLSIGEVSLVTGIGLFFINNLLVRWIALILICILNIGNLVRKKEKT